MKEFIITWYIENISYSWCKTGEQIVSPTFVASPIQNSSWSLRLYPRGDNDSDFISLYLQRGEDHGPQNLAVHFELSCITASANSLAVSEFFRNFPMGVKNGHPRFLKRHEVFFQRKTLYLPQDILTFRCRIWIDEGNIKEIGQSFGRNRLGVERILSVKNFRHSTKETFHIHSELQNKDLMSFSVFYHKDKGLAIIQIIPIDGDPLKFSTCTISFMDKRNKNTLRKHETIWLGPPRPEKCQFSLKTKQQDAEDSDSVINNLELMIEFVYSTGKETKHLGNDNPNISRLSELVSKYITTWIPNGNLSDCPRISQDLCNLYLEQVLCDVELKTLTTSFFAHKFVLCARSPVFLAMLTGDMKESKSGCIEIEDIKDDILKTFLFFLYNDTFADVEWDAVIGLYYAADKYQVGRLKILCCSYLLKNISFNNVCELLILSDRHNDSDFKRRLEDFILQNDEKIFSSLTWKQFAKEQPDLTAMTMILRYDKKRDKPNSAEAYDDILLSKPNATDDFKSLYHGQIASDIVIKARRAEFPAHKTVLFASSSILREAFRNDLRGTSNDFFKMKDLKDDIVSRMLLFLYTDSLGDIQWNTAIKLYSASVRYQIERLYIKCSCFLIENMETSNASELLVVAREHRDARLKSVVEDFILLHDEEIFGSDKWADFSKANPRLAMETMRSKYRKH